MKLTDIFNKGKLTLSFEVFPPKNDTIFDSVKLATEKIAALSPAFVSVTYGAGGGTSKYTLEIAQNIQKQYGVPTLAHLTCISSNKQTVREKIKEIKDSGIENIMALRGDIPKEGISNPLDYTHAYELVEEIRREWGNEFCIGAACYPETHPESRNSSEDIAYLKEKVDAGVDFLTTQMFFDNPMFYSFMYRIREKGIVVPVIPGIMPITSVNQIQRVKALSGSYMPKKFIQLVDKFSSNPNAMKQAGIAYAIAQIIDLYANGIKNIHVYTMNNPEVAEKIISSLSDIINTEN